MTPHPVIMMSQVNKFYPMGESTVHALRDVDMQVEAGEFLAIMGPSGSGKSTLMNIIGLLDRPDTGEYLIDGIEVGSLNDNQRSGLRNKTIGFIFQSFNLLPRASARRNVMLPLTYRRMPEPARLSAADAALSQVGLGDRLLHNPTQLSGGQRQRVAIARALVGAPSVILADEPTGNLDTQTGSEIVEILHDLARTGQTVILVTHDPELARQADRTILMRDGALSG